MQDNKKLSRAKKAKDDEFYTPREYVEELLPYLEPYKDEARILCPCDSEDSFYYRVLKENRYNVKYSNADFRLNAGLFPYNGRAIEKELWDWSNFIITNPPFSLAPALLEQCYNTNKRFCLLVLLLTFVIRKDFNKKQFLLSGTHLDGRSFIRPDGSMKRAGICDYIQNFKGRTVCRGFNPPIYSNDCTPKTYKTSDGGTIDCFYGGALPIPGTYKKPFLAPISCYYRIDENVYEVQGTMRPIEDGKQKFFKMILKYKGE